MEQGDLLGPHQGVQRFRKRPKCADGECLGKYKWGPQIRGMTRSSYSRGEGCEFRTRVGGRTAEAAGKSDGGGGNVVFVSGGIKEKKHELANGVEDGF